MRVSQIRISRNVNFFADRMMRKFNLTAVKDTSAPVVMYGMYNTDDYAFLDTYEPFKIVLWRGTDAIVINKDKANIVLRNKNCKHYAASNNVMASLARHKISSTVLPITSTPVDIKCAPRGDSVYCYIGSKSTTMQAKYKISLLRHLQKSLPYKFIYTTLGQYTYEGLLDIYKKCFVGIRLLGHDGMSNSILEMGLMGRRTISNADLPYTIRWKTIKDIRIALEKQYEKRDRRNGYISDAYRKIVNIGDKWLYI